ncbi:MAG: transporter, partial [Gammaproteobacteria bacterium]|nr:transporter [Gammaproteobacteria bacterium]
MIKKQQIFFTLALSTAGTFAYADHPTIAFGTESSGPISTISAMTAPVDSLGIGVRTEIINNDAFSTEQLENFAASGLEGVHSADRITSTSLSLSYGITDKLSVSTRLPYIKRDNIREGEVEGGVPEVHVHGDSSGFGDLLVLTQYKVSDSKKFDVSMQLGVKTPTGETHEKDNDNIRFETEFQPGSGSWDFLIGTAISK